MDFYEVFDQVLALLRQRGRVSYRALKVQFHLDDEQLDALKEELLYTHQEVVEEDGRGLVWTGGASAMPAPTPNPGQPAEVGERVEAPPARSGSPPAAPPVPEAERRQLTVLFCDLVDSTVLASQLDPEELREVIRAYQVTCAEVIQRYDGHIAQYLGDGLLVYFGYPQAHEDDAHRAIRTGLEIVDAVKTLNTRLEREKTIQLAIRLGIHTGVVVVGEMGGGDRREQLALGETPNVAARIQGLAAPDTVVISAATYRLVGGYFACEDGGSHALKGVSQPMAVYRVLQDHGAHSRLDVAAPGGLTPLVGRESEMTLLLERWARSQDGVGQVVFLSGEPGIGKSRLVEQLREHVGSEGYPRIVFRCSPYHTNSALYPVIEYLKRLLHLQREDPPEVRLVKLEQGLRPYRFASEPVVALLAALLSVPLPDGRDPPVKLSPEQQKQQTCEALTAWVVEEAGRQPVLVVYEDLHWADPSTLAWLSLLLEEVPTARMLALLTGRPEFRPPWPPRSHVTQLTLNRFTRPQVERMIVQAMHGQSLPPEVVRQVLAKTDGVPLFIEELLKMILESGLVREEEGRYVLTGPLPPLAIPSTLQDSLMARLDRLATVREIAQLGAVLGREFSYEMIRAVAPWDEPTVQHGLAQLVEAELIYRRGLPPRATYLFKHALIQDAAYQSLLRSTRQLYHQRIAQVLEARFPETTETEPELLAHHYTAAGLHEQAVGYWRRAGQRALERSANLEAISHLTHGLELLGTLPERGEHLVQELALQTGLGVAFTATKGNASPEAEQTYRRAWELCRQLGEPPERFPVLHGLYRVSLYRGELQTAREVAEQYLRLAQHGQDPALLLEAHRALAVPLYFMGELALARTQLEQAMTLYDPQEHGAHAALYNLDPGVLCLTYAASTLWLLGYPEQARQRDREALALAQKLSHPHSLAWALARSAYVHRLRREAHAAQEQAEATMSMATEHGFPQLLAEGMMVRGWARAEQGAVVEGIAQMQQGLAASRRTGAELGRAYNLGFLARAYGKAGQADEGLRLVTEALVAVRRSGTRLFAPELYRSQGELLLQQAAENTRPPSAPPERAKEDEGDAAAPRSLPSLSEAEPCFQRALDVARRQEAKSLELRAAMSLGRLWQQQGKRAEAHALLAPVYSWFTEGFDTADLQEANALLDELS
jgi:predicted ATPase/class 3 adenylate cyclase